MNAKIYIMCTMALGLSVVACDNYEEPNPPAQSNPQDAIFEASNLEVTTPDATFDLAALTDQNTPAEVSTYTVKDFPSSTYELQMVMQISQSADFAKTYDVAAEVAEDGKVEVNAAALQGVYYAHISKNPVEAKLYVRYIANAVRGSEILRIGGRDAYYGSGAINIKPYAPGIIVEPIYYLAGTTSDGTIKDAIKLQHSDVNQYDDPVFTIVYDITPAQAAAGFEWYVIPESTYAAGVITGDNTAYGPADATAAKGDLTGTVADGKPSIGVISENGPHLFTFNMETKTYTWFLAIENLYTPGNSNGWSQTASQQLYTWDYSNYMGFAHLNGDFKFTSAPNWDGINYGAGAAAGELSTDGSAGNLSAPGNGLYWAKVNIAKLEYTLTPITSLGCIGGFNSWGGQEPLTPDADYTVWTGTVHMNAGDEWKFRANDDWGINLGGNLDELTLDGSNIKCEETGDYVVTLNVSILPYSATVVKK